MYVEWIWKNLEEEEEEQEEDEEGEGGGFRRGNSSIDVFLF